MLITKIVLPHKMAWSLRTRALEVPGFVGNPANLTNQSNGFFFRTGKAAERSQSRWMATTANRSDTNQKGGQYHD
jgi:hypothetical protein